MGNGVKNKCPQQKPRLKINALLTVQKNYPKRLVPEKMVKRKVCNTCNQGLTPKQRKQNVELVESKLCLAVNNDKTQVDSYCAAHQSESEELQKHFN